MQKFADEVLWKKCERKASENHLCEQITKDYQSYILYKDKPLKKDMYPTMKPIKLLSRLISNSSKKGDIVLDSFGGSGSTLIACEQLDRKSYTVELDPNYCDVIIIMWRIYLSKML